MANLMAAGLGDGDARTFRAREVVGAIQRLEWVINHSEGSSSADGVVPFPSDQDANRSYAVRPALLQVPTAMGQQTASRHR
jgi:hypothetical protein